MSEFYLVQEGCAKDLEALKWRIGQSDWWYYVVQKQRSTCLETQSYFPTQRTWIKSWIVQRVMDQPVEIILDHVKDFRALRVLEGVTAQLLDDSPTEEEDGAHDPADEGRHQEDDRSPVEAAATRCLGSPAHLHHHGEQTYKRWGKGKGKIIWPTLRIRKCSTLIYFWAFLTFEHFFSIDYFSQGSDQVEFLDIGTWCSCSKSQRWWQLGMTA